MSCHCKSEMFCDRFIIFCSFFFSLQQWQTQKEKNKKQQQQHKNTHQHNKIQKLTNQKGKNVLFSKLPCRKFMRHFNLFSIFLLLNDYHWPLNYVLMHPPDQLVAELYRTTSKMHYAGKEFLAFDFIEFFMFKRR